MARARVGHALLCAALLGTAAAERTQILSLRQPACATVGGEVSIFVDYATSDSAPTTAVSFKTEFDATRLQLTAGNGRDRGHSYLART